MAHADWIIDLGPAAEDLQRVVSGYRDLIENHVRQQL
jgi:hypothetical protein